MLRYDDIPDALADDAAVYIDISGSARIRATVHRRLEHKLAYSCAVGATHWDELGREDLPGPAPVSFFAPDQGRKRAADWGAASLRERIGAGWAAFMQPVTHADQPWLTVVRGRGTAAIEACYAALLDGTVAPGEGHVLSV